MENEKLIWKETFKKNVSKIDTDYLPKTPHIDPKLYKPIEVDILEHGEFIS